MEIKFNKFIDNNLKILIIFLCINIPPVQAEQRKVLRVYSKTKEPVCFVLSDKPKIYFKGEEIVFSSTNYSVKYPLLEFSKFTFEDDKETGIRNTSKDKNIIFNIKDKYVYIANGLANSHIFIFNIDGILQQSIKIDNNGFGYFVIPKSGVYIIKNNKQALKIIIK